MSYIGDELPEDYGCGMIINPHTMQACGAKPVVRHYVFKELIVKDGDEYHPTGFSCDKHVASAAYEAIWMWHPVSTYCQMEGSSFNFSINECTVDVLDYERALFGEDNFGAELLEEMDKLDGPDGKNKG